MEIKMIKKVCTILCLFALCLISFGVSMMAMNASALSASQIYLTVDVLTYEADYLPNGVVGKAYPVFDYEAVDENGNTIADVDVLVAAPDGKLVKVSDAKFVPSSVGTYTITYKATKGAVEKVIELAVKVIAESEYEIPSYTINNNIVVSAKTGSRIELPEGQVTGGIGNVVVDKAITYSGDYVCGDIEINDFGYGEFFIPEVEGTYELTYTITDIFEKPTTVSKEITVVDSTVPVLNKPSISMVGKVGEVMTFGKTEAVLYVDGKKVFVPVKTYLDSNDITQTMEYTPTQAGSFVVKYEAVNLFSSNANDKAFYEFTVQVIDAEQNKNLPYVNNFLYLDGFTGAYLVEPDKSSDKVPGIEYDVYTLTADGSQSEASFQYKLPIVSQYAFMKVGFNTVNANFNEVYLYYTDSVDGDKYIAVCLKENEAQKVDVYVNGRYEQTLSKTLTKEGAYITDTTYCFEIDRVTGELKETTSNTRITTITAYANGEKFDLFASGKVYLSAKISGITGTSDIKLYEIATQNVSSYTYDKSKPLFSTPVNYTGVFNTEINKPFFITQLTAIDMYDTDVKVEVRIMSPSGETIYSGELTGNNSFTPTMYGEYSVIYRAVDSADQSRELKCKVKVIDRIAPIVSIVDVPSKVKVGDEVTFEVNESTDNASTVKLVSWIYVTYGNYQRATITKERKFKFEKAGTYVVKYGAEDEDGNFTVVSYTIVCE